mmetsp:Transcript_62842/g.137358  ORF Transcript_62842/g.137358 Transcript_62842/m.137358 type:complete len:207 (-) Transcript_62842:124-744(-)
MLERLASCYLHRSSLQHCCRRQCQCQRWPHQHCCCCCHRHRCSRRKIRAFQTWVRSQGSPCRPHHWSRARTPSRRKSAEAVSGRSPLVVIRVSPDPLPWQRRKERRKERKLRQKGRSLEKSFGTLWYLVLFCRLLPLRCVLARSAALCPSSYGRFSSPVRLQIPPNLESHQPRRPLVTIRPCCLVIWLHLVAHPNRDRWSFHRTEG